MKISLQFNGLYVSAEQGGGIDTRVTTAPALRANRTECGPWETFELQDLGSTRFALRTSGGFYVTAENGGGAGVRTNEMSAGVWETFELMHNTFRTWDGWHALGVDLGSPTFDVNAEAILPTFTITPLEEPEPAPGPVDRRTMKASYCSHRDDDGEVVFDPIYFGLWWQNGARDILDACLAVKRRLGVNAIQLCVQGGYGSYMDGATYDFRADPAEYGRLCTYVRDEGFTPIILVATADGGTHKEIYDGTMQRVLEATAHLANDAWYCAGYEQNLDRGGAYSARQQHDAALLIRKVVGDEGLILSWLQPLRCTMGAYWGNNKNSKPSRPDWNPGELVWTTSESNPNEGAWIEADDPAQGGEQEAWYVEGGLELDGLWYQTDHGSNSPSYAQPGGYPGLDGYGQPRYFDRLIEICDRFLPPGTRMPGADGFIDASGYTHGGVAPSHSAPDWFHQSRKRGRPVLCVGETVPYEYTRGQCCDEAVQECSEALISLGITAHGCWQP